MKKLYYIIGILVVIIIVLLALLLKPKSSNSPTTSAAPATDTSATSDVGNPTPSKTTTSSAPSTTKPATAAGITYSPASAATLIKVTSPIVNATLHITSTVSVAGQAKGSWFFEGSFPAVLTDAQGTILGQAVAKAQSNWMTDSFVAFTANIAYTHEPAAGSRGYVILKKDNPSGLPQNDASVKIPVIFE